MRSKANEYLGKTFCRLTVLEAIKTDKPRTHFKCRCQCGNEVIVSLNALQRNNTKSCGCLAIETRRQNGKKLSPNKYDIDTRKDDIYKTYCRMLRRCYWKDAKNHKKYYQDKGIKVCDEWKNDFMAFKKWAIENGYKKGVLCLTDTQKQEIFEKRSEGYKLKTLANDYNVSLSTIKKLLYKEAKING